MQKPYQRLGSDSNTQVGNDFERTARTFFASQGVELQPGHPLELGVAAFKKAHAFDLGSASPRILVECKCHRWTRPGDNVPSAKLTVWNEAMYYFLLAPADYRKVLFVLRDLRGSQGESLATYYIRTYGHLIPAGVEIWEYDDSKFLAYQVGFEG